MTGAQKRDRTRERLLCAAHAVFSTKGYVAASIEEIAAEAGHTRGAFYSNFRDKTELLLELLRRDSDALDAELQRMLDAGGTREAMQRMALAHYRQCLRRHGSFLMWTEAKLQAIRDPVFREHFNALLRERHNRVKGYVAGLAQRASAPLRLSPDVLAIGLTGLCDGVQFGCAVDPQRFTDELADAVLTGFFEHAVFERMPE
ncbi:TetR family transcriptional regulator [Burkholderia pyrrocinia]|uniref:TetR/AcrR family transcriptional regulator n=1 Tax=Burkholderia stagnalis TaxID=1503054 RepID=UPI00075EC226|nr:TetR/AcrR family transcriptional regulator [Burkholderia stagnalis]KVN24056.1 TetR family transcriptional regulator [Burkholderia pyrrocinia]WGS43883.1 TetR/AcrR family transcriptional regulator [Burkholderia sp. JSH-S8]